jgi:hypothetical protein
MNARIKGHDYRRGIDMELSGAQWRELLSSMAYTRRIGNGILAFAREDGRTLLAFEIFDDSGAVGLRRREQRQ